MRAVIIGNSGSGKTWLACRLATSGAASIIHLDHLFWEPGRFDRKRSTAEVQSLIEESKRTASWVVEGVFGDLAEHYLTDSDTLIWLDLEWSICRARLERRGSESKAHMNREQSEVGLSRLIEWASNYYTRTGKCSRHGHQQMFNAFSGRRVHVLSEEAANALFQPPVAADAPQARAAERSRWASP
jgi:adenylate kinase family enzyme